MAWPIRWSGAGNGMRTFLAAKFPLFDSTGVAYAVCGVATDITEDFMKEYNKANPGPAAPAAPKK